MGFLRFCLLEKFQVYSKIESGVQRPPCSLPHSFRAIVSHRGALVYQGRARSDRWQSPRVHSLWFPLPAGLHLLWARTSV